MIEMDVTYKAGPFKLPFGELQMGDVFKLRDVFFVRVFLNTRSVLEVKQFSLMDIFRTSAIIDEPIDDSGDECPCMLTPDPYGFAMLLNNAEVFVIKNNVLVKPVKASIKIEDRMGHEKE